MSRIGKNLCLVYALIIFGCFVVALSVDGDFKGYFVFLQLPIALQMTGIDAIGLSSELQNLSWVVVYIIIGIPTFLLLYFVGWAIEAVVQNRNSSGTPNGAP